MIELLSALAVFTIMALALYIVFDRANAVWRHGEYKVDQYQATRTALDMMSRELSSAIIATGGSGSIYRPYLWSVDGTSGSFTNPNDNFDQDQIYFILSRNNALYEVGYYIDDQGTSSPSDDLLRRAYSSETTTDFDISSTWTSGNSACGSFGSCDDFAIKVTDLNFKFIYKVSDNQYSEVETLETNRGWDTRMAYETGLPPLPTSSTTDDGLFPDFIEITLRVVDQAMIEKYNGSNPPAPPKADRKEFKIMIPMNQRSFRNG